MSSSKEITTREHVEAVYAFVSTAELNKRGRDDAIRHVLPSRILLKAIKEGLISPGSDGLLRRVQRFFVNV